MMPKAVYRTLVQILYFVPNFKTYLLKELDALSTNLLFGPEVLGETLYNNGARWHHRCHQRFTQSRLDRAISRKRKLEEKEESESKTERIQRRKSSVTDCVFCSKPGKKEETLHDVTTMKLDTNLRTMALELNDFALISKLSGKQLSYYFCVKVYIL